MESAHYLLIYKNTVLNEPKHSLCPSYPGQVIPVKQECSLPSIFKIIGQKSHAEMCVMNAQASIKRFERILTSLNLIYRLTN